MEHIYFDDDEDFLQNDFEILDIIEYGFPRRIYERSDYFHDMDDLQFFKRFRLTKPTVLSILAEIENVLEFQNDLNNSISPINQLLTCLRFYGSGGHLSSIADYIGMHDTTVSRIRVLGCIDCTHIRIQSPGGEDPEVFRNRKAYFSINTQVVGDSTLKIRDIVARWPGSAHDSTILGNSTIRARFEGGEFPNNVLLGDSGYSLKPYLLTPLPNPTTRPEQLYNEAHIRTRNSIERLFGTWKRHFPVLAYGLRVNIETVKRIIVATAVLHNIAVDANEPPPTDGLNLEHINYLVAVGQIADILNVNEENDDVSSTRDELINNYFSNLR